MLPPEAKKKGCVAYSEPQTQSNGIVPDGLIRQLRA